MLRNRRSAENKDGVVVTSANTIWTLQDSNLVLNIGRHFDATKSFSGSIDEVAL